MNDKNSDNKQEHYPLKPLLIGMGIVLALVLLMGADSVRHPGPATDDMIPVGDGTKFVSTAVANTSATGSFLKYNTSTNTFSSGTAYTANTVQSLWTNVCPSGETCDGIGEYYFGETVFVTPPSVPVGVGSGLFVNMSAATAGSGGGNAKIHIRNITDNTEVGGCEMPCTVGQLGAACIGGMDGGTFTTLKKYGVYVEDGVGTLCTSAPSGFRVIQVMLLQ